MNVAIKNFAASTQLLRKAAVIGVSATALLMFATAALNIVVALNLSVAAWSMVMATFATGSKIVLFLIQYAVMRYIAIRRHRARIASALPLAG